MQKVDDISYKSSSTHSREREYQAVYRAYCFGQLRLLQTEKPVGEPIWRRNKAKSLLKWFLLNPGKLCSADQLIDLFWPDTASEAAMGNLHVTMHYLRHLLEPSLTLRQESKFIRRKPNNFYWFHMDETWWIDTVEVQHLYDTARAFDKRGDHVRAAFYYRKAVHFCSLGFLPEDTHEEWLLPYRRHYEHIYHQVLMRLIQLYQQRNELDEVLEYAYQALLLDPYCERATESIIGVHMHLGNIDMAMRKLDDFQKMLNRDLGIGSRELHRLREEIIAAGRERLSG